MATGDERRDAPTLAVAAGPAGAPSVEAPSLSPGTAAPPRLAGRYELLGLIGVGGMGSVYRAKDTELDELVAVKVLRRDLASDAAMLARFRQEVKLARKVTHRSVARTFDLGEDAGDRFLTMELIPGESVASLLSREGALPIAKVIEIVGEVCEGLAAAHAAGVIHRDLKPDNVLVTPDGRAVITDFGIARALEAGAQRTLGGIVGTPAYMAPEQVEAKPDVDERADVYALGAMTFELLTGKPPWRDGSIFAVAAARLLSPPPDPRDLRADVPDALAQLVLRCMARKPEDRPPSALDVSARLAAITLPANLGAQPKASVRVVTDTPQEHGQKTVAVLPFRNGGADEYLVEGFTDDLIDSLSVVAGLRLRPRSAVMKYKNLTLDARETGRELGVQVVVDGSVRANGNDLRIAARLLSVQDGFQIWARRWDVPRTDVLKVADHASRAIAEALTVEQKPGHTALTDPEALDLYLRGRHEFFKFGPDSLEQAIGLFAKAAERAPNDPSILSSYALAISRRLGMPTASQPPGTADDARTIAEKAARVAPDAAEPLVALSAVALHAGDGEGAAKLLAKALERAPLLPDASDRAAMLIAESGPSKVAVARAERAMALEPRFVHLRQLMARAAALEGDWDTALAQAATFDVDRTVQNLVRIRTAMWRADRAAAQQMLDELSAKTTATSFLFVPLLRAIVTGVLPEDDRAMYRKLVEAYPVTARGLAGFHQVSVEVNAYVGEYDEALESLRTAAAQGLFDLEWLDRCPALVPLRGLPGFQEARATVLLRANGVRRAFGLPEAS